MAAPTPENFPVGATAQIKRYDNTAPVDATCLEWKRDGKLKIQYGTTVRTLEHPDQYVLVESSP